MILMMKKWAPSKRAFIAKHDASKTKKLFRIPAVVKADASKYRDHAVAAKHAAEKYSTTGVVEDWIAALGQDQ